MSFILLLILDHFGKPSAQKISDNEICRNWDPTDSNPNNPWHTYSDTTDENKQLEKETESVVEVENNEINNN